jgi:group I intron endonuclease
MASGIYCIENINNNKKYIGYSRNFSIRFGLHKSYLRRNLHVNRYLQSAWNKYGEECFNFYIIEEYPKDEELLKLMEIYFIAYNNSYYADNCGYNLTRGGEASGRIVSDETRIKLSLSHVGYKWSEESKEKLSKTNKGKKRPHFRKFTDEERQTRVKTVLRKKKKKDGSSSIYCGVVWDKSKRKWTARMKNRGKMINLGRFDNEIDAARARDTKCWELYRDLEMLNFPEDYK